MCYRCGQKIFLVRSWDGREFYVSAWTGTVYCKGGPDAQIQLQGKA